MMGCRNAGGSRQPVQRSGYSRRPAGSGHTMAERYTRPTSALLINEPPLQVLPTLACAVGLSEAIVLQQLHYWLQRTKHERDGRLWVHFTYQQWQAQFPWWSIRTLKTLLPEMESRGLILTANYNRHVTDRTKWYTINYAHPHLSGQASPATRPPSTVREDRPSNPLLISEPPLQVVPTLARVVGLNAAIVLQQLHYRLQRSRHVRDARPWVYNTYEQWQEQFPWWSIRTLKRLFQGMEGEGIILVANYNRSPLDRTKWYTIDYKHLILSVPTPPSDRSLPRCDIGTIKECNIGTIQECSPDTVRGGKSVTIEDRDWHDQSADRARSNQERTSETSIEIPTRKVRQKKQHGKLPAVDGAPESIVVALLDQLVRHGITATIASKLVGTIDPATIEQQVNVYDWLCEQAPDDAHVTPGRLRRMIEEDWAPPRDFVPPVERARLATVEQTVEMERAQRQERVREEERRNWAAAKSEYAALLASLGLQAEDQTVWHILVDSPRRLPSVFARALFYAPQEDMPAAIIFRERADYELVTGAAYAKERVEIEHRIRDRFPNTVRARQARCAVVYLASEDVRAALTVSPEETCRGDFAHPLVAVGLKT